MSHRRSRNLKYGEETDRLLEGGDADDAAKEEAPKEDAKEKEPEKEEDKPEPYDKDKDPYLQPVASPCCCCMCVHADAIGPAFFSLPLSLCFMPDSR